MYVSNNSCDDRLILDVEKIEEDLKLLKIPTKISRTIKTSIRYSRKQCGDTLDYASFLVGLQKCKLRSEQEVVIKRFVLERAHPDTQFSLWPPPLFITTITILQTIFFVYHILHLNINQEILIVDGLWNWDSIPESVHRQNPAFDLMNDDPEKGQQIWRIFTTMFVHTDVLRYATNVSIQLLIGIPMELEHGFLRILIIYFAGQISGGLYARVYTPENFTLDALPAIYALLFTQLVLFMLKKHSKYFITLRKIVVYLLVAVEIANLFLLRYLYESQVSTLEKIISQFNIMNKNSEKLGIPIRYGLNQQAENLLWSITNYEQNDKLVQMTGGCTGLLLGISLFGSRSSSLKLKHIKVILASIYVMILGFAVMWVSRSNETNGNADQNLSSITPEDIARGDYGPDEIAALQNIIKKMETPSANLRRRMKMLME